MADNTPVGSLSEFLAKRAAAKAVTPADQVTQAPTPQSEASVTPTKMAPPPKTGTYNPKYQPSFLRKSLGAIANEAFGGSGHLGRTITGRIRGDHLVTNSAYARATPTSAGNESVDLSSPTKTPSDVNIGVANNVRDIESQVIRVDKEVKDWGKYVVNEFTAVRKDVKGILDTAKKTQSDVDRIKKDLAEETFKKRVADAKIRNKNGRLMSAVQLQKNPYTVHPNQKSLAEELLGELESLAAGAAATAGVGVLAKLKNALTGRGGSAVSSAAEAEKAGGRIAGEAAEGAAKGTGAASEAASTVSKAARGSKYLRGAGKILGAAAGAPLDVAVIGGMTTREEDDELQNGKDKWSNLRSKYSQETIDAARKKYQPWYQIGNGYANENEEWIKQYLSEQNKPGALSVPDKNEKSDGDVVIDSKKDISIKSVLDIHIEARNELTIKARVITLDADRLELKGGIKGGSIGGAGLASSGVQNQVGGENLSPEAIRYRDLVTQFGREGADERMQAQSQRKTDPMYWVNRAMGRSNGDGYRTPKDEQSQGYNTGGTGYRDTPSGDRTGKYRPKYDLGDDDLHDDVVNTIAGEAYTNNQSSVDAVIHNMMNRVGTKSYGPSGNLRQVARAPGQYEGYRNANSKEAEYIRARIKAIASGEIPDPTGGANEFRASSYGGPWAQKHAADGKNIGGNTFAYNKESGLGSYAPYKLDESERQADPSQPAQTTSTMGGGKYVGDTNVRGVDPRIQEIVAAAAGHLPDGYKVSMTSGFRSANEHNHNGNAADFHIVGPDGQVLSNRGEDPTGMYTKLAQHAYGEMLARHPDLKGQFAWGGAFGTQKGGGGQRDLMHFDINGERGRYSKWQLSQMGLIEGEKYGPHATPDQGSKSIDSAASMVKKPMSTTDKLDTSSWKAKDDAWFAGDKKTDASGGTPTEKKEPVADSKPMPPVQGLDTPDHDHDYSWMKKAEGVDDRGEAGWWANHIGDHTVDKKWNRNPDPNDFANPLSRGLGISDIKPSLSESGRYADAQQDADAIESLKASQRAMDAEPSNADISQSVPVPDTSIPSGEDLTQQIKGEVDKQKSTAPEVKAAPTTGNANERISVPRHHPESEAARPGSDGYGDQQHNPDDCSICSLA